MSSPLGTEAALNVKRQSLPPVPFEDQNLSPVCSQSSASSRRVEDEKTDDEYSDLIGQSSSSSSEQGDGEEEKDELEEKTDSVPLPPVSLYISY